MPPWAVFLLFAALFLFPGGTAAYAQQKYALVIGNGAYTGITRLNNPVNDANDVYVAGYEKNAAGKTEVCYWKSGAKTVLSDKGSVIADLAIAVSGNDVYVAGSEKDTARDDIACYWKNGVKTVLSDASRFNGARAIALVPR
jgi:hypothetical protein